MKILILSVPRSPPTNVTVHSTGNTSLMASWKPVPSGHEQGIILGYKIFYVDTAQFRTNTSIFVCSSILSVNLTSLQVYTYYCVQVLAFTIAGEGVLSECVVTRTDEGGTKNDFLIFFFVLFFFLPMFLWLLYVLLFRFSRFSLPSRAWKIPAISQASESWPC